MILENRHFRIEIRPSDGAITSLYLKKANHELIAESRLATAFRLCVPVEDYQANYVEGVSTNPAEITSDGQSVTVTLRGMQAFMGELDITLSFTITLDDDAVKFSARLTNNSDATISEFWFPRIGGITGFDAQQQSLLAVPGYIDCAHQTNLVRNFPGGMGLGAEAAEWSCTYPGMVMPWWDFYDAASDTGLYLGYHDITFRYSTWHTYLWPTTSGIPGNSMFTSEDACGEPVGLVFSHVRYPFLNKGESLESGEFILRVHDGDWHYGSKYYRDWFMENFPFDKKDSWLRKKSSWFTSIIYQPEDRVVTDYKGYDAWCRDAESYGVDCHELIGWDKGGLERDYPVYAPEDKLGGREGFRELMHSIRERDAKSLVFVNYNILDSCTQWYKDELRKFTHQDPWGNTPNWMCWGESTLLARSGVGARRHHLASFVPEMEEILEGYFLELVKDGACGFQIDKLCVGSTLDFNPLNTEKPDVAACEGMIRAIARLLEKCQAIDPEFRIAAEAGQDRLLPYIDVYYRNVAGYSISPLRYVFPEWTACQHVGEPRNFGLINAAVMLGAVICAEPQTYQASMAFPLWRRMSDYIAEVERIRRDLADIIFTGEYCDTLYAQVEQTDAVCSEDAGESVRLGGEVMIPGGASVGGTVQAGKLHYRVHRSLDGKRIALVVANSGTAPLSYNWKFTVPAAASATLYMPFAEPKAVTQSDVLTIAGTGLHILVAECEN